MFVIVLHSLNMSVSFQVHLEVFLFVNKGHYLTAVSIVCLWTNCWKVKTIATILCMRYLVGPHVQCPFYY